MIAHPDFPRLTANNHRITSPASSDYNCIAWSAGDTLHWWQPGIFWPVSISVVEYDLQVLVAAFATLGYTPCADGTLEVGVEKVALYCIPLFYTHAARQLPSGKWTSKLGHAEDIEHDAPEDVAGGVYGDVVQFVCRPIATGS